MHNQSVEIRICRLYSKLTLFSVLNWKFLKKMIDILYLFSASDVPHEVTSESNGTLKVAKNYQNWYDFLIWKVLIYVKKLFFGTSEI